MNDTKTKVQSGSLLHHCLSPDTGQYYLRVLRLRCSILSVETADLRTEVLCYGRSAFLVGPLRVGDPRTVDTPAAVIALRNTAAVAGEMPLRFPSR